MLKIKILALAAAGALCASAAPTLAQTAAITGFTGNNTAVSPNGNGSPATVGYQFTANQALSVTALGVYDYNFGTKGPLQSSHQVGIFTTSGTLLGSAMVSPTSTLLDGYRYTNIAGLALTAGQSYLIGAFYSAVSANDDGYYFSTTTVSTSPAITFGSAATVNGATFSAPTTLNGTNGRFGPNFLYTTATSAVPEPATWAMMILGMGAIGFAMRRRQKVSTSVQFA